MKLKTVALFLLLLALSVVVFEVNHEDEAAAKDRKGFCFDQNRFLTDEEFYDTVIVQTISLLNKKQNSLPETSQTKDLQFASLDDFYSKNPYCCYPVVDPLHQKDVNEDLRNNARIYGKNVYRFKVFITVDDAQYATNLLGATGCGELLSTDIRVSPSTISSVDVEDWDPRPNRKETKNHSNK